MSPRLAVVILLCTGALIAGGVAAARWAGTEHVLSSFTTDLGGRNEAQRRNVRLAAARIHGKVLPPGAAFSFNEVVGQRLVEAGYEKAATYQAGTVVDTTGGGICQLSSTLYNAALLSNMRIVERAPHAARVLSVGPGRDATVVYGRCDLRFVNPHPFTVCVRAREVGLRLVVELVGSGELPAPVEVRVERVPAVDGLKCRTWRRTGGVEELVSEDEYR